MTGVLRLFSLPILYIYGTITRTIVQGALSYTQSSIEPNSALLLNNGINPTAAYNSVKGQTQEHFTHPKSSIAAPLSADKGSMLVNVGRQSSLYETCIQNLKVIVK
jgi:hypothetical protein